MTSELNAYATDGPSEPTSAQGMASPRSVTEMLLRLSDRTDRGPTFLDEELNPRAWSYSNLVLQAKRHGQFLREQGIVAGERVALLVVDPEEFVTAFFGALLAGAIPVPLALPVSARALATYITHVQRVLASADCAALWIDQNIAALAGSLLGGLPASVRVLRVEAAPRTGEGLAEVHMPEPDDTCFLQYTSGSTAAPKGVIVTHGNLVANSRAIIEGWLAADANDVGVSWLPLFHDMGLIGVVIAPLLIALPVVFIPTLAFVRKPSVWMEVIHRHRGTISIAPNFAFALAVRRARNLEQLDLSCLRVIGCGAEPINPDTLQKFVECHKPAGLRENIISPVYGLAEATLLVSCRPAGKSYRTLEIDRAAYESERRIAVPEAGSPDTRLRLVGCGFPAPDHEIRIADAAGAPLPEGHVGEILLRGPSCTPGYFNVASERREFLATGDLGFMCDGELFISGRKKDLIILNGRNLYPQTIEWEAEQVDGVRRGGTLAFSVPGTEGEELVILAESNQAHALLPVAIRRRLADTLGIPVREACIVSPGTLPKTSSGKLQRSKAREQWLNGEIAESKALRKAQQPTAAVTSSS